jgi:short-subunit dehydrogenase
MKIEGTRMLITGAAGGIGSAVAAHFAKRGVHLILTDLREDALAALVERLPNRETDRLCVAADVTTEAGRAAIKQAATESGVDVLVNVAGVNPFGLFDEQSAADIERTLLINTTAPMLLCHTLLPVLHRRSDAHIVNVGSAFGSIGFPANCTYSASKFAIRGFSEALRRELGGSRIAVHYIAPRATQTRLNTDRVRELNKQLGVSTDPPTVVAHAIEQALTTGRSEIHIGWPERLYRVVNALLPGIVDRSIAKNLPLIRRYASKSPSLEPKDAGAIRRATT